MTAPPTLEACVAARALLLVDCTRYDGHLTRMRGTAPADLCERAGMLRAQLAVVERAILKLSEGGA